MIEERTSDPIARAREVWQTVFQRRWVVLVAWVGLSALAIVALSLWPDTWEAVTTVVVDPQKVPDRYASITSSVDPARLNALTQEVLSASRLEQIIDELELLPKDTSRASKDRAITGMQKGITVDMKTSGERGVGTFTITYDTKRSGAVAAAVADRLAASFIKWSLASRKRQVKETTQLLTAQLQEASKELDVQDARLSAFKAAHVGKLPEQSVTNSMALSHLQTRMQANSDTLNRLEQERIMLTQAPDLSRTQARSGAGSERSRLEEEQRKLEARLSELRARYSDEFPDVQVVKDQLADTQKRLESLAPTTNAAGVQVESSTSVRLQIIGREMKRIQEEQERLTAKINGYQMLIDGAPLEQQQLGILNREYQEAKDHYQSLLEKTHSADLAADIENQQAADVFTIIDTARIPESPIKPKRLLLIFVAIPVCFLLSVGGVLLAEGLRGNVNTESELRLLLPEGTATLGRIPVIETPMTANRELRAAAFSISASLVCIAAVVIFLLAVHPRL